MRKIQHLKIVETKYGRTIEAWTASDSPLLQNLAKPPAQNIKNNSILGLAAWGCVGLVIGRIIFYTII